MHFEIAIEGAHAGAWAKKLRDQLGPWVDIAHRRSLGAEGHGCPGQQLLQDESPVYDPDGRLVRMSLPAKGEIYRVRGPRDVQGRLHQAVWRLGGSVTTGRLKPPHAGDFQVYVLAKAHAAEPLPGPVPAAHTSPVTAGPARPGIPPHVLRSMHRVAAASGLPTPVRVGQR